MSKWIVLGLASAALSASAAAQGLPQSAAPAAANSANGATAFTENGFGIFQSKCLSCHGKPQYERAPSPAALREMTPEHLFDVLSNGVMYPVVGKDLSERERRQVAESVAGRLMGTALSGDAAKMPNRCASNPPLPALSGWNGWGADS